MHFYEDNITLRDDFNNLTQRKFDFTLETKAFVKHCKKKKQPRRHNGKMGCRNGIINCRKITVIG